MTRRDISERFIIHRPNKYFFVAVHARNEKIFQLHVKYGFEILNSVSHHRLA